VAPPAASPSLSSRPDPYSQIHNPLNVGWGTTPAPGPTPEVTPPTVALPAQVRTRSGWVRRLLPVLVLLALVALAWWQRDWISDTVDGVLDDSSEQGAAPSATPVSNGPAALVDPTEVYLDWERANYAQVQPLAAQVRSAKALGSDDPLVMLQQVDVGRSAVATLVLVLDTAPDSPIRSDILALLTSIDLALADLRAAAERADATGIATAQQQLDRADEQLDGLQERYGDRSILLR
jgi:hypothetical protein